MTQIVTRSYANTQVAHNVVRDLESAGIATNDISLLGAGATPTAVQADEHDVEKGAGQGAGVGGAIGGVAGLLAGLGVMAIPGLGPVVAAGWIVATLTGVAAGAAAGGVVGALTQVGFSQQDAETYSEDIRRGGTVVSVQTDADRVAMVELIMDRAGPITTERRSDYRLTDVEAMEPGTVSPTLPLRSSTLL